MLRLVDYWAPWCAPCKVMNPFLEKLQKEFDGKILIEKVNIEDSVEEAIQSVSVRSIPTLIFYKDDKEVDRIVGYQPALVREKIQANIVSE